MLGSIISEMRPESWLPLLHDLADRADELARRYFRAGDLHVKSKPDRTLVTQADLAIETMVREVLQQGQPEMRVYGEEQGDDDPEGALRLIVDPIDGTYNFARGIPIFATLLAVEVEGTVVAGLASAAALGQRWHAALGHGAWCGTRRLRVSEIGDLADAHVFHGSLAGYEAVAASAKIPGLLAKTWRQRGMGDFYQHVLVAEGSGEVALDPVVAPWDVAPLGLIVEEAGGRATTVDGKTSIYGKSLVSTNGLLHDSVLAAFDEPPSEA